MTPDYRTARAQVMNQDLDRALLAHSAGAGLNATVESVYQIFRDAECSALCCAQAAQVRDRAQAAFTALRGYPITWSVGVSYVGLGGALRA